MASIRKSMIRTNMTTLIQANMTGYYYTDSTFNSFGRQGHNVSDKTFVIGYPTSNENGGRQRAPEGIDVSTEFQIKIAYQINPHAQATSDLNASDGEEDMAKLLTNRSTPLHDEIQLRYSGSERETTGTGEFIIVTQRYQINHYLPL